MTLEGQRVLVLRPRHQAQGVLSELRRLGAEPLLLPAIDIAPPEDPGPLEGALSCLETYDWLVLTSANGVKAVFERVERLPEGLHVAAVGPRTADALREVGVEPELVPEAATAESLAEAMSRLPSLGRVLFPKAERAREVLPERLRAMGAHVDDPVAYRCLPAVEEGPELERLRQGQVDWVLVTSPAILEALWARVDAAVWTRVRLASIGPVSSEAIRRHGLEVAVEATPHTMEGLIAAMAAY